MAAELRNVVALTLHESGSLRSRFAGGFEGTDLATLAHLEYPQSATGILERGGFLISALPRTIISS